MAKCAYHPNREAVGSCVGCGRLVCAECKAVLGGKIYCNPCAEKQFAGKLKTGVARAETAVARAEAGAPAAENTSGQGSLAVIPDEIRGWNWGAFLLGWIWGIGNSVWIALLELIPYFNFIWMVVLGAKGSEWAWRSKRWDSIEHFKRTQSTWTKWGLGIFIFLFILGFIIALAGY